MCAPIRSVLANSGAEIIIPPEAHGLALERYCRQRRIPVISVDWFRESNERDVVYREIEGLGITSDLVLVRGHGGWRTHAARQVWDAALVHFAAASNH